VVVPADKDIVTDLVVVLDCDGYVRVPGRILVVKIEDDDGFKTDELGCVGGCVISTGIAGGVDVSIQAKYTNDL
jgi:hypothetical protein